MAQKFMNKSGFADVLDARAVRPRSCDVYIIIGVKLVKIVKNVTHVTHVSHRDDSHKRYGWKNMEPGMFHELI